MIIILLRIHGKNLQRQEYFFPLAHSTKVTIVSNVVTKGMKNDKRTSFRDCILRKKLQSPDTGSTVCYSHLGRNKIGPCQTTVYASRSIFFLITFVENNTFINSAYLQYL